MVTREEILQNFEAANMLPNGKILDKCMELCILYSIDAEDFVDQWLAYTVSNLQGAPPSLEGLDTLERKVLKKLPTHSIAPNSNKRLSSESETCNNELKYSSQFESNPPIDVSNNSIAMQNENDLGKFSTKSDSLSILCSFGNVIDGFTFKTSDVLLNVKLYNEDLCLNSNSKYMYEKMWSRAEDTENVTNMIVKEIINKYQLQLSKNNVQTYAGEMVICGRIYIDNEGSTKNFSNSLILLEGTIKDSRGLLIKLNTDKLEKLSFFPGQIVVVKGNNIKGDFFVAETIYSNVPPLLPSSKSVFTEEKLQVIVASGHFTPSNNLLFEPLNLLINYVLESKPNLLILIGPFIDNENLSLESLNESYESFFGNLIESVMDSLKTINIQVIIIPSDRDIHNHNIYPSLPFTISKKFNNLFCAPNPCMLDINGLVIGASSADIIFHLSKQEIYKIKTNNNSVQNRMDRLINHILNQRSFYPLYPPDLDIRIDYKLQNSYGMLDCLPHILILPSKFKHYIKKINNCLVINPERLVKGQTAGCFVRIEVNCGTEAIWDRMASQVLQL